MNRPVTVTGWEGVYQEEQVSKGVSVWWCAWTNIYRWCPDARLFAGYTSDSLSSLIIQPNMATNACNSADNPTTRELIGWSLLSSLVLNHHITQWTNPSPHTGSRLRQNQNLRQSTKTQIGTDKTHKDTMIRWAHQVIVGYRRAQEETKQWQEVEPIWWGVGSEAHGRAKQNQKHKCMCMYTRKQTWKSGTQIRAPFRWKSWQWQLT